MFPAYEDWIQDRVRDILLSFSREPPSYPLLIKPPTTVENEKYNELRAECESLKKENRELTMEVSQLKHEKGEAKHMAKVKSELLVVKEKEVAKETTAKERILQALKSSSKVLLSKKRELARVATRIYKFDMHRNTAITANKVKEGQYLEQIENLKAKLRAKDKEILSGVVERRDLEKKFRETLANLEQLKLRDEVKRARGGGTSVSGASGEDVWEFHNRYLTRILHRRDVIIQELVQRPNYPNTKKLLREVPNWCKRNNGWGVLARMSLVDSP